MRRYVTVILLVLALATGATASTMTLTVDHHLSTYGRMEARKIIRATFVEEPVFAEIRLDIYAVPQLPSSREHLDELRALPKDDWWKQIDWRLVDLKTNRDVPTQWRVVSAHSEERGPSTGDKTKAVDTRMLRARFELVGIPSPGDYELHAKVAGLRSAPYVFAVRTGREDDARDAYLALKATRASDFKTYRALQMARVSFNPTNAAAYLELANRSLEHGTLAETNQYFQAATAAMERLIKESAASYPQWAKQQSAEWAPRAARIRALQRQLPEYFARRSEWRISTDPATGNYVIRARRDNRIIREVTNDQ